MVAHRGSSDDAPEHTLHAYKRAIDDGADALECDVRLTKDGHLVCVHDRRIDRTSNGRGILSTLELAELTELDWGSWRDTWEDFEDPEMPDRDRSQILTLRRLLEAVAESDRRVEVAIETKHPTRYAGLVERRLVALLDEFGWAGAGSPVRVMSFSQLSLRRLRLLAPDLRTVDALRAGAAAVPGRQPARGRGGGRTEHRDRPGPSPLRRCGPTGRATRCTSGRSTPPRTSRCASSWASRRSSPTGRGRVLRALGRAPGPARRLRDRTRLVTVLSRCGRARVLGRTRPQAYEGDPMSGDMPAPRAPAARELGVLPDVSLSVPHERTGVRLARHAFADQLAAVGVADEAREDAMLVLSELVSNAVKHAAPLPSGEITVRWSVRADVLHIEITDGGAGHPAARQRRRAVQPRRPRAGHRPHGQQPVGRHRGGRARSPSGPRCRGPPSRRSAGAH